MKILDFNQNFLLVSNDQKTSLLKCPELSLVSECLGSYRLGSLQYGTGIAALGASSQIRFYDFKYERKMEQVQTVLKLLKLKITKNLLFCVSAQRILIYDIAIKNNLCYIPTSNGNLVQISSNYYTLKILYPIEENIYIQQEIWTNKTTKIKVSQANILKYDRNGENLCMVKDNMISLYEGEEVIRGCPFETKIVTVITSASPGKFYIATQSEGQSKVRNYLQISLANKFYLKISGQLEGIQTAKSTQNEILFENKGKLLIWKDNKVYRTEINYQPNFSGSITQWTKPQKVEHQPALEPQPQPVQQQPPQEKIDQSQDISVS